MPLLRQIASLWSLRDYPHPDAPWEPEAQLDAVRAAGFDGVTGRVGRQHGQLAVERSLIVVGFVSSGDDAEFGRLLDTQKEAGARQVNVQLADHDTPTREALRLTHRLFEEADRIGELEISIEVHRDTCTETPEKTYALADAYFAETGQLLPITWDFSHLAIVKHLQPKDFSSRLLDRPELVLRASQFHFRPFNGHHCQVPVTTGDGSLTREMREWLPFVADTFSLWLKGNRDTEREIFVVPEMGPASSGYNLDGLPNSWEEAARLRPILVNLWHAAKPKNEEL
jgi:sugar phosphate isomerase/epimerase